MNETDIPIHLIEPVTIVRSVGPAVARNLQKIGILTVADLLYHFPQRYLDPAAVTPVSKIKIGQEVIVVGKVYHVQKMRSRKGTRILRIGLFDGTGYLFGVWFNQDYLADRLKVGTRVSFRGQADFLYGQLQMQNPLHDVLGEEKDFDEAALHTRKIVTFHPATAGLSTTQIRRLIKNALEEHGQVPEFLPGPLIKKFGFPLRSGALRQIHFPGSVDEYKKARTRFIFEELFLVQIGIALRKKMIGLEEKGICYDIKTDLLNPFYASLPFSLTEDQQKVIREIQNDMRSPHPMNRLLQGEVGSGKTVVALAALLTAVQGGYQGTLMAPTEILANQHYLRVSSFLKELPVKVVLLTGSQDEKDRKAVSDDIKTGRANIIIGTHALIQENVSFQRLGLIVIDEQHRFGVKQRISLKEKGHSAEGKKIVPDVLIMTATPIPRTLSLTLYGDLDISALRQSPSGIDLSKRISTYVCDLKHRQVAYDRVRQEVAADRQTFIICPLIEESDKIKAKAVMQEADRLKKEVFPDLEVGLIHGRMSSSERDLNLAALRQKRLDVLISTTIIEVGIDLPDVSVILIEDADRFGLSQLHQLRGRIGRKGDHHSYCFLFADPKTEEGKTRMKAILETYDGFELADKDLEIRGEGQLFGEKQSGLPDLRLARLSEHLDLLLKAREAAFDLVDKDPRLALPEHRTLYQELKQRFKENFDWIFHA